MEVKRNLLGWVPAVYLSLEPYPYWKGLNLCARLSFSPDDMTRISQPLIDEIKGHGGLGLTVWFPPSQFEKVCKYYEKLGCIIHKPHILAWLILCPNNHLDGDCE